MAREAGGAEGAAQLTQDLPLPHHHGVQPGGHPEQVLRRFKHSLVNKWLHTPSVTLRKLAAEGRAESLLLARELLLDDPDSPSEPK